MDQGDSRLQTMQTKTYKQYEIRVVEYVTKLKLKRLMLKEMLMLMVLRRVPMCVMLTYQGYPIPRTSNGLAR